MHIVGAIFFFFLALTSGSYGFFTLFSVTQTFFGTAKYDPALPTLQFLLSLVFIAAAVASVRACAHCRKSYLAGKSKST